MAKRFTDSEKWKHDWFTKLSPAQKCLWFYILDHCDGVGVWPINLRLASFQLGEAVDFSDLEALGYGTRVIKLAEDKAWIPGFITFQYKSLNAKNAAHRGMMRTIIAAVSNLTLKGESLE